MFIEPGTKEFNRSVRSGTLDKPYGPKGPYRSLFNRVSINIARLTALTSELRPAQRASWRRIISVIVRLVIILLLVFDRWLAFLIANVQN